MLQEVGVLPTLVNFYLRVGKGQLCFNPNLGADLWGFLDYFFNSLRPVSLVCFVYGTTDPGLVVCPSFLGCV